MKFEAIGEFILTYSWGLLIVGIVISTLAAFGYLDFSIFFKESCVSEPPFQCLGLAPTNISEVEVVIRNTANYSLSLDAFTIAGESPPCGGIRNITINKKFLPANLTAKDIARIRVQCVVPWSQGDMFKGTLKINYRNESGKKANSTLSLDAIIKE